jgi:hypothetical protein
MLVSKRNKYLFICSKYLEYHEGNNGEMSAAVASLESPIFSGIFGQFL